MARMLIGNVKGPAGIGIPSGGTTGQMLKKASATDYDTLWDTLYASAIPVSSSDSTKVDAALTSANQDIANVQNGLAYIVGNTNTTGSTLAVGQFVYVKGHSTITEGLRKVTASISANGNITTSNTSACSDGGLNALYGNIENLLTNAIVKVTTADSVASEGSAVIAYPTGFTKDNSIVIAAGYESSSLKIYNYNIDVVMYPTNITVYNHTGSDRTLFVELIKK